MKKSVVDNTAETALISERITQIYFNNIQLISQAESLPCHPIEDSEILPIARI